MIRTRTNKDNAIFVLITTHRNKHETPKVMFTLYLLNVSFYHCQLTQLSVKTCLCLSEVFDGTMVRGHVLRF